MSLADQVLDELRPGLAPAVLAQIPDLSKRLAGARRIVCYGVGREGLMMKSLAMRLFHAAGDVLLVSAGPGNFSTVAALSRVAQDNGAHAICFTAQPGGPVPIQADHVVTLPAQTMAADQGCGATSILPMGSLYEALMFLFFEFVVLDLRDRMGVTADAMRTNHTNLE